MSKEEIENILNEEYFSNRFMAAFRIYDGYGVSDLKDDIADYFAKEFEKENTKLKQQLHSFTELLFYKRKFAHKYLEEERAKREGLLFPDADEIYEKYFEIRADRDTWKEACELASSELNYYALEEEDKTAAEYFYQQAQEKLKGGGDKKLITLKLTYDELKQLESEFLALNQQGCLDENFCKEMNYEFDKEYVDNFYSMYSKIQKAIRSFDMKQMGFKEGDYE